ncbi:UNVERIFIED_CONTAM: hypothetical protein BJ099_113171 [Lysinibacillus xylanilyticus]
MEWLKGIVFIVSGAILWERLTFNGVDTQPYAIDSLLYV